VAGLWGSADEGNSRLVGGCSLERRSGPRGTRAVLLQGWLGRIRGDGLLSQGKVLLGQAYVQELRVFSLEYRGVVLDVQAYRIHVAWWIS